MQRLFVMFPDRAPGVGLLWLRLCLATALCWPWPHAPIEQWFLAVLSLLLGSGWLTPLAVSASIVWLFFDGAPPALVALPVCLLLLGPGAYSLDACLFGRRVLVGRRRADPSKE